MLIHGNMQTIILTGACQQPHCASVSIPPTSQAWCFRASYIPSVQSMNESSQTQVQTVLLLHNVLLNPSNWGQQELTGSVQQQQERRRRPAIDVCFPKEQRANCSVFEVGKHICVSHSSVWLCLPTLRTASPTHRTSYTVMLCLYDGYMDHTQPQILHTHT